MDDDILVWSQLKNSSEPCNFDSSCRDLCIHLIVVPQVSWALSYLHRAWPNIHYVAHRIWPLTSKWHCGRYAALVGVRKEMDSASLCWFCPVCLLTMIWQPRTHGTTCAIFWVSRVAAGLQLRLLWINLLLPAWYYSIYNHYLYYWNAMQLFVINHIL